MTAPAKAAASELLSSAHEGMTNASRYVVDVLLRPFLDELSATFYGIAGNTSAQQRGGNDPQGRHMGDKGQTRLRCPVCRLGRASQVLSAASLSIIRGRMPESSS